jgi:choline-glycine betaine transporter
VVRVAHLLVVYVVFCLSLFFLLRKDTTQKYKKKNPKNKEKRQKTEQKSSKQTN